MKVYTEKTGVVAIAHILKYLHLYAPRETFVKCCGVDSNSTLQTYKDEWDIGSEQADAIIDIIYYMCNALVKLGVKEVVGSDIDAMFACVKEFTEQSMGKTFPIIRDFNQDELTFIIKMVLSECEEFFDTVALTKEHSRRLLNEALEVSLELYSKEVDKVICSFATSFLTTCCECIEEMGLNPIELFSVVHNANMNKRDPLTNTFIRRDDGKILKPPMWQPPDMRKEVIEQARKKAGLRKSY